MRFILLAMLVTPMLWHVGAQAISEAKIHYGYTFTDPSGNRYIGDAAGSFPDVGSGEIRLDSTPLWVVGGLVGESPVWVVALDNGRVLAVQSLADDASISGLSIELGTLAPGTPPAVAFQQGGLPQLIAAGDDASPRTHPLIVDEIDEKRVYVSQNGDLILWREGDTLDQLALNLQPDARPVLSDGGLIATYSNATNERYVHAIMGDDLEGASLVLVAVQEDETLAIVTQIDLPDEDVFEGISPFWADINDDGEQEIVTTVSNGRDGAWIRVYDVDGAIVGESRPIGQGFRWRHQLAAAPFGIAGETQIVDVRTPHIGGMVEFFTLRDALLSVNNAQLGYTSHLINSPNLDMGVAGDFDGDEQPELVITDQARQHVVAVANTPQGVAEVWRFPLSGTLTTNLTGVRLPDGRLALAAGTDAGILHVWH